MGESSEPQKSLPAPEEKKKQVLNLSIDLKELYNIPQFTVPENQVVWQRREDMSPDYMKLNQTLQILAMYIARSCNEGPEVKDNVTKRLILVRTVIGIIMDNIAITGYDAYGLLTEMLQETFMKISGRRHILGVISEVKEEREQEAQEKAREYTD